MLARLSACFTTEEIPSPEAKGPHGAMASNKHVIGADVRGTAFQITEQRVANILRERQSHLVSSFPYDLQCAVVPINVGETQMGHVSRSQS